MAASLAGSGPVCGRLASRDELASQGLLPQSFGAPGRRAPSGCAAPVSGLTLASSSRVLKLGSVQPDRTRTTETAQSTARLNDDLTGGVYHAAVPRLADLSSPKEPVLARLRA
jgi:hypothetical protein